MKANGRVGILTDKPFLHNNSLGCIDRCIKMSFKKVGLLLQIEDVI